MAAAMHILKRRISITAPRGLKASSCARKGALSHGPRRELPLTPASDHTRILQMAGSQSCNCKQSVRACSAHTCAFLHDEGSQKRCSAPHEPMSTRAPASPHVGRVGGLENPLDLEPNAVFDKLQIQLVVDGTPRPVPPGETEPEDHHNNSGQEV